MRIFHKHVYISIAALFIAFSASAQDGAKDGGKDANDLNVKVDAIFAQYDKPDSPGCALGVIKDGKLVYERGYGMANLEHNIPNGPKLVYDIGSTSKQFTAASILLLAQQGKLSLDDDVRKHIPELPAYQKPITIRHLLHHTSGLRDYLTLFSLAGVNFDDTTTEKDALDIIARQKALNFTPGDEWLYSNSGYFLLSIIIKRASGKSFAEFAKENIFDQLGMKHTLILDNHKRIVPMRATAYSPNPRGGFQIEMSNFEQTGDGAVQTSIEDLSLWDQNFYEPKVGGKAFLEQIQTVGALNNGEKHDYASGLIIGEYKGLRRVSHGGSWAGYRAELARFPEQKFSVACLCNLSMTNPSILAMKVADVYLAEEIKALELKNAKEIEKITGGGLTGTVVIAQEKLKEKAGIYRSLTNGGLRRITLREGNLWIDDLTMLTSSLKPVSETQFIAGPDGSWVEFKSAGAKTQLLLSRDNRKPETFERVEAFEPSAGQLNEFAGSYYSEELNTTYKMSVEEGRLFVIDRNGVKRPLAPTIRDSFAVISGPQFEFSRDAAGKVSGFAVHAGRIRNVRFSKSVDSRN
ncbi:MAG TPA: serine hydrolase domain-containing protein [Blastocatellia bacterium]|nr:serine hydrolase domain-containing protein [Blastocatellia bacterium]